ncbi:MAG: cysteine hydrolase [Polyangiaceae bacterium]|nr:cysteine hydrolase [Polyangiaceae bacterium]
METTALILIDIQNDYFPGGALPLVQPEQAAEQAGLLLDEWRAKGQPVIHVRHHMAPGVELPFLRKGTPGAEIFARVAPQGAEPVITKHFPSAFTGTELEDILAQSGAKRLVIAGMMTHMCVSATSRAAMERGYHVTVPRDATATRDLEDGGEVVPAVLVASAHLAALAGGVADVTTTAAVLT